MRLSEAIGLGRTLVKAKGGVLLSGDEGCALGMGMKAIGAVMLCREDSILDIHRLWPWTGEMNYSEPCGCGFA